MKPDLDVDLIDRLIEVGALQIFSYFHSSGGIPSFEDLESGRYRERRKSTVQADLLGVPISGRFDRPPGSRKSGVGSAMDNAARVALADALEEAWSSLPRHVLHEIIRIMNRPG